MSGGVTVLARDYPYLVLVIHPDGGAGHFGYYSTRPEAEAALAWGRDNGFDLELFAW